MPKLSIVVPVYNVAPFLKECLDSIVNQTVQDLEIVLVDDGSTDGSTDICRYYASIDSRIKLIIQENAGVAAARKAGTAAVTGQYLGFVDADDYIEPDMYETLLKCGNDFDLVTSGYYKEGQEVFDNIPQGIYRTPDEMNYILNNMIWMKNGVRWGMSPSICNKLFRVSMAKPVFTEINTSIYDGEDLEFLYRYLLICKSVHVTKVVKYHYRWRATSTVHSINNGYIKNVSDLYLSLSAAFRMHPNHEHLMEHLQRWTLTMLLKTPRRMDFSPNTRVVEYISPFLNVLLEKKVALYGAGAVGQSYYLQMMQAKGNEPVIWVDQRYEHYREQFPVRPVEDLVRVEYDYVLIAIEKEGLAQSIKQDLLARGIAGQKILWKTPISILIGARRDILPVV